MTTLWYAIIYAGLLILTVSASKSDILKTTKVSWISMENLKSMLIVSFNSCSCCNVFIDGESVMTEHFFNGFIKTYSGGYTLNRPTYVCSEYLMIFSSADRVETAIRSAPTKTAILEVLIVVTNDDEELTRALNVSLFGIANVNVATFNGLWTLSENFLTPRIFKKVSSHREITHERRTVNLRGREVRATAYYKPPYCHIRTTVNRTINGVTREYFIPKNNSELDGIDMKIFILIAERLNFTWNIRKPINPHHWLANQTLRERYGMSNGTHWIGGMIGELNHKEVDIAFTSVWVSVDKLPFTNLTKSWAMIRIRFLVPRPKPSSSFWALTRPLSNEVWSAILAMLAIKSIYVYTSAWVNPRIPTRLRSFVITWTEMMGRLIGISSSTSMQGLQLQFQLWHFIGILLVTAYSSSLAADLTNLRFEKRIDTARDFVEANLTWGTQGDLPHFSYAVDYTDPDSSRFADLYEQHANEDDRNRMILGGNYAILGNTILSIFFPEELVDNEFLTEFRLMEYSPAEFYVAFAVQPWLLEPVDEVMLRLTEVGIVQYQVDSVLQKSTGNALREVLVEHDGNQNGPTTLQLTPLGAGYVVLIMGLFVSTVVFYFELRSASTHKSIREILLNIEMNRKIRQAKELKRRREQTMFEQWRGTLSMFPPRNNFKDKKAIFREHK